MAVPLALLGLSIRLALAAVCVLAAAGKARDRTTFGEFTRVLDAIGVPARVAAPVAAATVAAELAVAALLLVPHTAAVGCLAAVALFATFTVGVAHAVRRGRVPRCRCFGRAGALLGRAHLVRNTLLVALSLLAWWATAAGPPHHPDRPSAVLAAAAAALATLVITSWDDLAALIHPVGRPPEKPARPDRSGEPAPANRKRVGA